VHGDLLGINRMDVLFIAQGGGKNKSFYHRGHRGHREEQRRTLKNKGFKYFL
jgi:hypothetical protein